jgi:lysophospholipase L1-like esterase
MNRAKSKPKLHILIKLLTAFGALAVALFAALAAFALYNGWSAGNPPFEGLYVSRLVERNKGEAEGGIVFYGASNFTRWTEINADLSPYHVINNGFGGSNDKLLVEYADRLLLPYKPKIIFFQTGSNDYLDLEGSDEEKIRVCMEYKKQMFERFHAQMPEATFVVMSGLLLPGRSQFVGITRAVNEELRAFCGAENYMRFINADDMTYDGAAFNTNLFVGDGIHLNREGQRLWAQRILPLIAEPAD